MINDIHMTSVNEDTSYIKYNYFAIGHFCSALVMTFLYINTNSLSIPYTESYLNGKKLENNNTCSIGSRTFNTSSGNFCIGVTTIFVSCNDDGKCYGIDLGWLIISFHILSFLFQGSHN